jgi:peptide/nickel transport system permease protein
MSQLPTLPEAAASSSYWQNVWRRFRQRLVTMIALRVLAFVVTVAICADFIAYDKPYTCVHQGTRYYPILGDYLSKLGLYQWAPELINADWSELPLESSIWPPVRHRPDRTDPINRSRSPFAAQKVDHWKQWHYLGTDPQGRDVLAGLVHGARYSLTIGIVAMGIAAFIGIILGSLAGYFGDNSLKVSRIGMVFLPIGLVLGIFYGFLVRHYTLKDALTASPGAFLLQMLLSLLIVLGCILGALLLAKPLEYIPFLGKKKYLWLDMLIARFAEIVSSLPLLLLLIALLAATGQKSIYLTMVLIGLINWSAIALYMRLEMLRVRNRDYIQSARALGLGDLRILFRHALPNSLSTMLILIAFGIAGAIGTEAALSFLGIGVPDDTVTWGKLLNGARYDIRAWWLSIFPGMSIFMVITTMNLIGEGLRDAMDPQAEGD